MGGAARLGREHRRTGGAALCASAPHRRWLGSGRFRGAQRGNAQSGAVPLHDRCADVGSARGGTGIPAERVFGGAVWQERPAMRISVSSWRTPRRGC
ncbi:hypothetical protein M8494_23150 [Serratia ureilytica]